MNLDTPEILAQVEELAGLLFTPDEIAIVIEAPIDKFNALVKLEGHAVRNAYMKGRLITQAEFRKGVLRLSNLGSSPAQTLMQKIFDETKIEI